MMSDSSSALEFSQDSDEASYDPPTPSKSKITAKRSKKRKAPAKRGVSSSNKRDRIESESSNDDSVVVEARIDSPVASRPRIVAATTATDDFRDQEASSSDPDVETPDEDGSSSSTDESSSSDSSDASSREQSGENREEDSLVDAPLSALVESDEEASRAYEGEARTIAREEAAVESDEFTADDDDDEGGTTAEGAKSRRLVTDLDVCFRVVVDCASRVVSNRRQREKLERRNEDRRAGIARALLREPLEVFLQELDDHLGVHKTNREAHDALLLRVKLARQIVDEIRDRILQKREEIRLRLEPRVAELERIVSTKREREKEDDENARFLEDLDALKLSRSR